MATNESLKGELVGKNGRAETVDANSIPVKELLSNRAFKKRFEEILDKRAPQFMSSIINLVNGDQSLSKCQPLSVISACLVAATMDLPIDKNLGYAWIVPYGGKATFQMGYKGYVQLALRSGQYRSINAIEIHEGELIEWNPLSEKLEIDFTKRKSGMIIGYAGYFELLNGFKKTVYWSKDEIKAHRSQFSKTKSGGVWETNFDAMALKTVIRNMLGKWGILSIQMQNAVSLEAKQDDSDAADPVLVNPDTGEVIDLDVDNLLLQEITLDEIEG